MRKYAVLTIDLKNSKKYASSQRQCIQKYIYEILISLNRLFISDVEKQVDFSGGDELQGLFYSPESAYLFYRFLLLFLNPVKIRAGIGVGTWDVKMSELGTAAQDGKVYHNARYAIEHADKAGSTILICSENEVDLTINVMMATVGSFVLNMTTNQNQLALFAELLTPICLNINSNLKLSKEIVSDLLFKKNEFDKIFNKNKNKTILDKLNDADWENYSGKVENSSELFIRQIEDKNYFITNGKVRGLPTEIANILSVSRFNIETSLNSGNTYLARNIVLVLLNEMRKIG